jgi:hypothetical protein
VICAAFTALHTADGLSFKCHLILYENPEKPMIIKGRHDRDPNAEAHHFVVDMTVRPHNETRSMNASHP